MKSRQTITALVLALLSLQSQPLLSNEVSHRFTFVNGVPQFNITEKFFALYIGVWRGFDEPEIDTVQTGASLLSKRHISWKVEHCETPSLQHQDFETIWTYDQLRLNDEGLVVPIIEANRPGFRYFSMTNLHGLYLRGTGEFKRPKRLPGETSSELRARIEAARTDWREAASPKHTTGQVTITLEMRLVNEDHQNVVATQFLDFSNYNQLAADNPTLAALFYKTAPNRWPVSYDERAHKPHAFTEPNIWNASTSSRTDTLKARLEWNWCSPVISARIVVPRGQLLPPGPNRSGRTDHGPVAIQVIEEDF